MFPLSAFGQGNTRLKASANSKSGEVRSFCFVSEDLPEQMRIALAARGYHVVPLPAFERLPAPVAKHADLLLYPMEQGLLVHAEYYACNRALFAGVPVIMTDEPITDTYPGDVLLNALPTAAGIFCREASISIHIRQCGKPILHTAQGYTRCACCRVSDSALITADPSIAALARVHGLDVLEISPGEIALPGYSYGFIGGASVRMGDEMLFMGDITAHSDYARIDGFLRAHAVRPVSLGGGLLTDYGGAVLITV